MLQLGPWRPRLLRVIVLFRLPSSPLPEERLPFRIGVGMGWLVEGEAIL